ncbi:hypothetical protein KAR91_55410 [Candidatus Pacearchaeota archaeon]|nr:hypothetical protein [Candidatus Pacearchaeota archaeon]
MSDLFERLFPSGIGASGIGAHTFRAAIGDYAAGYTTKTQIIGFFALDSEAQTDLTVLCNAIDSKTPLEKAGFLLELHDVLMLADVEAKYTTKSDFRNRLGL